MGMAGGCDIPLPSPCLSVCEMNPESGFCRGCFRTLAEIADWMAMTNPERETTLARLRQRREAAGGAKRRVNRRRRR